MANRKHFRYVRILKQKLADVTYLIQTAEHSATASECEDLLRKAAQHAQQRRVQLVGAERAQKANGRLE